MRQLQISIPPPVFRSFAERAGRHTDYRGGARRLLLIETWTLYTEAFGAEGEHDVASCDGSDDVRSGDEPLRTVHFQLPADIFRQFAACADRRFDFVANARARLFLRIWRWRCQREDWPCAL